MYNIIITYWKTSEIYYMDIFDSNTKQGIIAICLSSTIGEAGMFDNFDEFKKRTIDSYADVNIILSIMSVNINKEIFEIIIDKNISEDLKGKLETLVVLPLMNELSKKCTT